MTDHVKQFADLSAHLDDDRLVLRYVRLSEVVLWDENPKSHDLTKLADSFRRYGFVDPPKYDTALGALVYGNGRSHVLDMMRSADEPPPDGVFVLDDGDWAFPMVFGVDAANIDEARALAIDHNNLTMSGDFSTLEISRIWKSDQYLSVLNDLAQNRTYTVTVNPDDYANLLLSLSQPPDLDALDEMYGDIDERDFWPTIRLQIAPEVFARYERLMNQIDGEDDSEKFSRLLEMIDESG